MVKLYETMDLSLAAFLLISGFKLEGTAQRKGGWVDFLFQQNSELDSAIACYVNGDAKVDVKTFVDKARCLKETYLTSRPTGTKPRQEQ